MNRIWHEALYAAAIIVASLLLLITACMLRKTVGFSSATVAAAAILPLLLSRTTLVNKQIRWYVLALPPGAIFIAAFIHDHAIWGELLLVAVLSAAIWIRRFGQLFTRIGTVVSLPFVAMLFLPAGIPKSDALYASFFTILDVVAVMGIQMVSGPKNTIDASTEPSSPPRKRGMTASTRMSIHMGLTVSLALIFGHLLSATHWNWMVMTSWIVLTGTRSRGEVLEKGLKRIGGASAGTFLASWILSWQCMGPAGIVNLIFFALFLALWWRWKSYAYWAAGITFALGLFYSLCQAEGEVLLLERLQLIMYGGVLAIGVAWFFWPIRTSDLIRLRIASALASLSELLASLQQDGSPSRWSKQLRFYKQAVAEINIACAPMKAAQYFPLPEKIPRKIVTLLTWSSTTQESDQMVTDLVNSWSTEADGRSLYNLGLLRKQIGQLRRSMVGETIEHLVTVPHDKDDTSYRHELLVRISLHFKKIPILS